MPKGLLKNTEESKELSATDPCTNKLTIKSCILITRPNSTQKFNNLEDEEPLEDNEKV